METPCCTTLYCSRIWSRTCERPSAIDHVVFRDDLEPVHHWLSCQDVLIVRNAKADSDSVVGKTVEAICRHGENS